MNAEREIYRYSKDFGITKEQIQKSIEQTASKTDRSQDFVAKKVLSHIKNLNNGCINQAEDRGMKLKPYQKLGVEHMLVNRGMVAAYSVGTGKTMLAVSVANCILNLGSFLGKDTRVIVITPTSLQENFKKEMKKYGSDPEDQRYSFYTTAKFGTDYKNSKIDCSKTLFIVDEAHMFRTDYRKIFSGGSIQMILMYL